MPSVFNKGSGKLEAGLTPEKTFSSKLLLNSEEKDGNLKAIHMCWIFGSSSVQWDQEALITPSKTANILSMNDLHFVESVFFSLNICFFFYKTKEFMEVFGVFWKEFVGATYLVIFA